MHKPARRDAWLLLADPTLLAMTMLGVLLIPWFLLGPGGPVSSWLVQTGLDVLVVLFGWRLARVCGSAQRPARRFWRSVIIAGSACVLGDSYQTFLAITRPDVRGTSLFQTIMVVCGMGAVVATMLWHPVGGAGRQRLRLWLDAATVLTAVAVFLWYYSLAGQFTGGEGAGGYAAAASSAILFLIAFAVLKLILGGTAPFSRSAGIIGSVGVTGTAVGTSVAGLLTGGADPGVFFVAQLLPCVVAAASLRMQELQLRRPPTTRTAEARRGFSRLPYLAVIAVQILLMLALPRMHADLRVWGVAAGVVLITALVLSRQIAALRDNERLLTELDLSMRRTQSQKEWFSSLVQHASDVTLVIAGDNTVSYASPAADRLLGVHAENLIGAVLVERVHPEDRPVLQALIERLAAAPGEDGSAQVRFGQADGSQRWLDIVGVDLRGNPSVGGLVFNARDITESRALHDELRRQALHDGLTGLANRVLLEQRLDAADPGTELSVLAIDLDGFKEINDQHGHQAGDRLLVATAQRLEALVGADGTAVRLGGDEFAVLLPGAGADRAAELAERIAGQLAEPVLLADGWVAVGASIGVGSGRPADADRIMRDADAAMYRDKRERRASYAGG
ncbi:diguanylate cyclase domain-containing protein [Micromonosporaceae bacterium Da 78-11]